MLKLFFVNMPFASLSLPSIGLTQIKTVLESRFGEQVAVKILYLNHDFAHLLGVGDYESVSNSSLHHNTGFGDWVFRQSAFPELPDNTNEYFGRFYPQHDERTGSFKAHMRALRAQLNGFMDGLIDKYKLDEADIVGFTSMFTQHVASLAMARRVKERNPKILTLMGGANCESPMGQEIAKNVDYIDFVFSGPSLISLPQLVQNYLDGQTEKAHHIRGVFSKQNCAPANPLSVHGQSNAFNAIGEELDIDEGIILDYDEFLDTLETNFPNNEVEPILTFETSRGCWWGARAHCTFCGLNGATMQYRAMSPAKAIEQFEAMFKYADRVSRLNCVDNILATNYLKEVFPLLNPPPNVTMFYEVKADLTEEEVEILSKAHVRTIQPGIESLATSTLKLMKKGTSAFQNILLLKNCLTYSVHPEWNILVGFPGEGEEVYQKYIEDLPLLKHLPPPSGIFPVRFDRYSPYFTRAKEYGLDLQPMDYYALIYPFDRESLANLSYYFSDLNYTAPYFLTMVKWIAKVRKRFDEWLAAWSGKNHGLLPQLYFKDEPESNVVYDTRSGQITEHRLDEATALALRHMYGKPKRVADVAKLFAHLPDFNAEKAVSSLKERGLVFQEHDRLMSLVLPKQPEAVKQMAIPLREVASPQLPGMSSFR
jgi:ribosomal peptide maturation radical SAM protein 1